MKKTKVHLVQWPSKLEASTDLVFSNLMPLNHPDTASLLMDNHAHVAWELGSALLFSRSHAQRECAATFVCISCIGLFRLDYFKL